jgi:hypothetical protein
MRQPSSGRTLKRLTRGLKIFEEPVQTGGHIVLVTGERTFCFPTGITTMIYRAIPQHITNHDRVGSSSSGPGLQARHDEKLEQVGDRRSETVTWKEKSHV